MQVSRRQFFKICAGGMAGTTAAAPNDQRLGSVPKMGAEETHEAIDAANRALPAWRALTAKERAAGLLPGAGG